MNEQGNGLSFNHSRELFANEDAEVTWQQACRIVQHMHADFDFTPVRAVFDDVLRLFDGSFPGYFRIRTPYHDLSHTLSVFICATRMLHGTHLGDTPLTKEEIALGLIGALLHDVGYAQQIVESEGTGAQHLRTHVLRGIEFMRSQAGRWQLPQDWPEALAAIIRCTDLGHQLLHIDFPSPRIRLLGQIVGSSDVVGQMADRTYLEKLLYLYYEFEEARFGNYQSMLDMLKKTRSFYDSILIALNDELGGVYRNLRFHFQSWFGVERNLYVEAIDRNIAYLDEVIQQDISLWPASLKRRGIARMALEREPRPAD